MRIYLIDAFNLIHSVPEITDSATPHADLVAYLKLGRLTGSRTNRVVVVFDGYPAGSVEDEREYEVLFSKNRTADDLIREFVEKAPHKRQIFVVSDDHHVRDAARAEGAVSVRNAEFLGSGRKKKTKKPKDSDYDDRNLDASSREHITADLEKKWVKKG